MVLAVGDVVAALRAAPTCGQSLDVILADWIIAGTGTGTGTAALLLPGWYASIELLQTLSSGRKIVIAIVKLVPTGLIIALVLALILARRGQSLAVRKEGIMGLYKYH